MSGIVSRELVQTGRNRICSLNIPFGIVAKESRILDKGEQYLIDYAEQLEEDYIKNYDLNYRKTKGQFLI